MARLRDVSQVIRTVGIMRFARRVWQQVGEDQVFTWGAALAYSWLFAIFPFFVFLLSLVPLVPEQYKPSVKEQVSQLVDQSLPPDSGSILKSQINSILAKPSAGGFLSFGLVLTLWAASGGMAMTMAALDKAYDIEKGRSFIRHRFVAMNMTVIVATLAISVMILLPVGTAVMAWLAAHAVSLKIPFSAWLFALINVARYAIAILLMIGITTVIYYFGPYRKQRFHVLTPGAAFAIAVWILCGVGFKIYITKFGGGATYNKTYGAVAGMVILLLLFYLDAVVLLIGAEINSEIDFVMEGHTRPIAPAAAPTATDAPTAAAGVSIAAASTTSTDAGKG